MRRGRSPWWGPCIIKLFTVSIVCWVFHILYCSQCWQNFRFLELTILNSRHVSTRYPFVCNSKRSSVWNLNTVLRLAPYQTLFFFPVNTTVEARCCSFSLIVTVAGVATVAMHSLQHIATNASSALPLERIHSALVQLQRKCCYVLVQLQLHCIL